MNYSLPVSRLFQLSNQTVVNCPVHATQLMWAVLTSGGWSKADIEYKMIADVYVVLTLCILGFVGNAITVAVLRKDPDRAVSSTNWLLQTLALVDTIYLAARSDTNAFRYPAAESYHERQQAGERGHSRGHTPLKNVNAEFASITTFWFLQKKKKNDYHQTRFAS